MTMLLANKTTTVLLLHLLLFVSHVTAFAATTTTTTSETLAAPLSTKNVANKVAVAGATGRTGTHVVQELLKRNVNVVAMVRDTKKAKEVFGGETIPNLEIKQVDLTVEREIDAAIKDCDAAIWCATGFSDAPGSSVIDKIKKLVGIAVKPQQSIDAVGVPALAKSFATKSGKSSNQKLVPKVVMLSSAGVTRPSWDEKKKSLFPGSADIPIVRLNPFGILNIKAESEEKLRQSGTDYCIVRPAGLNDSWPSGSRPVFSQGDVAVGRINRKDVARILVDVLSAPEATGKTFEAITLAGYPPSTSINSALAKLKTDKEGLPSMEAITATYQAMQQLLPGEKQDSASLAMGQTYEQLDKNEEGRFGQRGKENIGNIPTRPS